MGMGKNGSVKFEPTLLKISLALAVRASIVLASVYPETNHLPFHKLLILFDWETHLGWLLLGIGWYSTKQVRFNTSSINSTPTSH